MVVPVAQVSFYFKRQEAPSALGNPVRSVGGVRSSSSLISLYIDGVFETSNSAADTGSVAAGTWAHGGLFNNSTSLSDPSLYYAQTETIGSALTDDEIATLHSMSLTFNTALGRS